MLNERVSAAKKIASDLHQAEDAIDEAMIRIAQLAATLPTARRDTNMSAIVGQAAMSKVANALAAAGEVLPLQLAAHPVDHLDGSLVQRTNRRLRGPAAAPIAAVVRACRRTAREHT